MRIIRRKVALLLGQWISEVHSFIIVLEKLNITNARVLVDGL